MLMEEMEDPPRPGDLCRVRYTGYESDGGPAPEKVGEGTYLTTKFWGGGRYQRVFRFEWGEEAIYDDHEVFECEVLRRNPTENELLERFSAACMNGGRADAEFRALWAKRAEEFEAEGKVEAAESARGWAERGRPWKG